MFELRVQQPWFNNIKLGKKTVEGRLNKNQFKMLKVNDLITFENNGTTLLATISQITLYSSFEAYLTQEGLKRTLPGTLSIQDGINIYRAFYSEEQEREYGVLAIEFMLREM